MGNKTLKTFTAIFILLLSKTIAFSQHKLTLEEALQMMEENNPGLQAESYKMEQAKVSVTGMPDMQKPVVYFESDQSHADIYDRRLRIWGVQYTLQFPTIYGAYRGMQRQKVEMQQYRFELRKRTLEKQVTSTWYSIVYLQDLQASYSKMDSLYNELSVVISKKRQAGEATALESVTMRAKKSETANHLFKIREDMREAHVQLESLIRAEGPIKLDSGELQKFTPVTANIDNHPLMSYYQGSQKLADKMANVERQRRLPDFQLGYFQSFTNNNPNISIYHGFQIGVALPITMGYQRSRVQAANIQTEIIKSEQENVGIQLSQRHSQAESNIRKYEKALSYYENEGKQLSDELIKTAKLSYEHGEIDLIRYINLLSDALRLRVDYLTNLNQYNQSLIELQFLTL